jgi:hypothetical protein
VSLRGRRRGGGGCERCAARCPRSKVRARFAESTSALPRLPGDGTGPCTLTYLSHPPPPLPRPHTDPRVVRNQVLSQVAAYSAAAVALQGYVVSHLLLAQTVAFYVLLAPTAFVLTSAEPATRARLPVFTAVVAAGSLEGYVVFHASAVSAMVGEVLAGAAPPEEDAMALGTALSGGVQSVRHALAAVCVWLAVQADAIAAAAHPGWSGWLLQGARPVLMAVFDLRHSRQWSLSAAQWGVRYTLLAYCLWAVAAAVHAAQRDSASQSAVLLRVEAQLAALHARLGRVQPAAASESPPCGPRTGDVTLHGSLTWRLALRRWWGWIASTTRDLARGAACLTLAGSASRPLLHDKARGADAGDDDPRPPARELRRSTRARTPSRGIDPPEAAPQWCAHMRTLWAASAIHRARVITLPALTSDGTTQTKALRRLGLRALLDPADDSATRPYPLFAAQAQAAQECALDSQAGDEEEAEWDWGGSSAGQ